MSDEFLRFSTSDEALLCDTSDIDGVLNIYFVDELTHGPIALCGYTYFPGSADRMLISSACASNGNTIAHEMGHYFSLSHTHGDFPPGVITDELVDGTNCLIAGDRVCDTPADPGLNYFNVDEQCRYVGFHLDGHGQSFQPSTSNLMSYSRIGCRTEFSPSQLAAINYSALYDRSYLQCACHAPGGLTANTVGTDVVLSWAEVHDAVAYQLVGRVKGQSDWRELNLNGTQKSLQGLAEGRTYQWKVRTRCADGNITEYSEIHEFRTASGRSGGLITEGSSGQTFPNPVHEHFTLLWNAEDNGQILIEVRNMQGSILLRESRQVEEGANEFSFQVKEAEPGLHILLVRTNRGTRELYKLFVE